MQRSSGIFGATGTGKSFLTRIILAGLIQHDHASVLIFDMHNEYGPDDTASDTNQKVPGLRSKFPGKVRMVGLGRDSTVRGDGPRLPAGDRRKRHHPGGYRDADPRAEPARDHPHHAERAGTRIWPDQLVPRIPRACARALPSKPRMAKRSRRQTAWKPGPCASGVNTMAAAGLHQKLNPSVQPALYRREARRRYARRDYQLAGSRAARGAFIWRIMRATWITCWSPTCSPARSASAGSRPPTSSARGKRQQRAAPAGDRRGRSAQAAQPRNGRARPPSAPSRARCASITSPC